MTAKAHLIKAAATILILFSFKLALAAIPASLNYQGHLTDSAGVPIDGPVNMVFSIYDIDTGGTAFWSDTRSVTVEQGVFSIELGGATNPFPPGLFENPLWMGLTVGTDAEMSPRRPISSVGFSFKADDANTVEGISATTLDQSAHVIDNANPHSVTAAQIGAIDNAALTTHTSDTTNPHSVSAAQTGAASSTDFSTHTSDTAAHHLRYTNIEAVSAMGVNNDSNAYNHNKYTNTDAVVAMLAADGAGSTLDADLVDGLQASELIDAAQDEVRTPISSLPFVITQPGSYYLTGNLDGSSGGIDVSAADVTVDLMGFTIDGGNTGTIGIALGFNNVTIKNGSIKGFSNGGIRGGGPIDEVTISHVTTSNNGIDGILIFGLSHYVESCRSNFNGGFGIAVGDNASVTNSQVQGNSFDGILSGFNSVINGNSSAFNGGAGITSYDTSVITNNSSMFNGSHGIWGGDNSTIIKNVTGHNTDSGIIAAWNSIIKNNTAFLNSGQGIYGDLGSYITGNTVRQNQIYGIYALSGSRVDNNTVRDNFGYGIYAETETSISNNTVTSNFGVAGIIADADSRLVDNFVHNNSGDGIIAGNNAQILNNTASRNLGGDGIYAGNGSSLIGNLTNENFWGINSLGGATIKDNQVYNNNAGGISVSNNTRVKGNTVTNNIGPNILVNNVGNSIEENLVADGSYGIQFSLSSGNFFANNRARTNTTSNYDNVGTNVDGGGNASF